MKRYLVMHHSEFSVIDYDNTDRVDDCLNSCLVGVEICLSNSWG